MLAETRKAQVDALHGPQSFSTQGIRQILGNLVNGPRKLKLSPRSLVSLGRLRNAPRTRPHQTASGLRSPMDNADQNHRIIKQNKFDRGGYRGEDIQAGPLVGLARKMQI